MPDDTDVIYSECYFCEQPVLPIDAACRVPLVHVVGLEKHFGADAPDAHVTCAQRVKLTTDLLFERLAQAGVMVKECDC